MAGLFKEIALILLFVLPPIVAERPTIVLQVSDLHFSTNSYGKFYKLFGKREEDFEVFTANIVPRVQPNSVLITGDLTDSKTQTGTGLQQEDEWKSYRKALDDIIAAGVSEQFIFDVRGNHDCFNVPERGGDYDFFSQYSAEGRRRSATERIFVNHIIPDSKQGEGPPQCPTLTLVGMDMSIAPGLKSPANFCGLASADLLQEFNDVLSGLEYPNHCQRPPLLTYGHFPLSTVRHPRMTPSWMGPATAWLQATSSAHASQGLVTLLLNHKAAVYVSGHLHAAFGEKLHAVHSFHNSFLAELESAAWKDDRRFRILALDFGAFSFIDLYLHTPDAPRRIGRGDAAAYEDVKWKERYAERGWAVTAADSKSSIIDHIPLITWPPDPRYFTSSARDQHGFVRAQVFPLAVNASEPHQVTLVVTLHDGAVLLHRDMELDPDYDHSKGGPLTYSINPKIAIVCPDKVTAAGLKDKACTGGGRKTILLQVCVMSLDGMQSVSSKQPALLECIVQEGDMTQSCSIVPPTKHVPLDVSSLETAVLSVNAPVLGLRTAISVWAALVFFFLLLPRHYSRTHAAALARAPLFVPRELSLQPGAVAPLLTVRAWHSLVAFVLWPAVALIITASVTEVWLPMLLYAIYFVVGPWLLADLLVTRPPSVMFWYGVLGKFENTTWEYLATPDTLLISIFHLALCVMPLMLWIACVVARRVQLQSSPLAFGANSSPSETSQIGRRPSSPPQEPRDYKYNKFHPFSWFQCVALALIIWLNVSVVYTKTAALMGPLALTISPGLAWTIPLALLLVGTRDYPRKTVGARNRK